MSTRARHPAPILDPGWLFLLAGLALLAATVVLPAQEDTAQARFYVERAREAEQHRLERLRRYTDYLDALNRGDPGTVRSLAASQLNQAPENLTTLMPPPEVSTRSASVFPALEPPPLERRERRVEYSRLQRWALDDRTRLWLLAGGVLLVFIGILPPSRRGVPVPRT